MDLVQFLGVALLVAVCVLCSYTFHKVRQIHLQQFRLQENLSTSRAVDFVNLFRQIEAARCLRDRIGFSGPLTAGGWAASADFLLLLAEHALAKKPEKILECGSGLSTVILAKCVQLNGRGHIYSLDHDERYAEQTRQQLQKYGLETCATVVHAPLVDQIVNDLQCKWYDLDALRRGPKVYDLIVIDGPPMPFGKMIRLPAGPVLLPFLAEGGAAFLDDAARDDERAIVERWRADFPELSYSAPETEKGCAVFYRPHRLDATSV